MFQVVSPKLKILNINARYPGARNDSYIWSTSPIRRAMEYHYNCGERHTWLIGNKIKDELTYILNIIYQLVLFI